MKTKANRRQPLLKTLEGTTSSKALSWLHDLVNTGEWTWLWCSTSVTSWRSSNHFVEPMPARLRQQRETLNLEAILTCCRRRDSGRAPCAVRFEVAESLGNPRFDKVFSICRGRGSGGN